MEQIVESSFLDFGKWYLEREVQKERRLDYPIPTTADEMEFRFKESVGGKYRPWFPKGRWAIKRLTICEFKRLMVLDAHQTRDEQLVTDKVPRTLENAAKNALTTGYFEAMTEKRKKHFWYYLSYQYGSLSLESNNRLAVISLNDNEKRGVPNGTYSYYLHDGWGRALPYMVHILQGWEYKPVEVFCAEEF